MYEIDKCMKSFQKEKLFPSVTLEVACVAVTAFNIDIYNVLKVSLVEYNARATIIHVSM